MPTKSLIERLKQGLFLLDGAMGTQLLNSSVTGLRCLDYFNIEFPEIVSDIHKAYIKAGSDAIITNTFGANRFSLTRHKLAEKMEQINMEGVRIARQAAGSEGYVLGDIGPSGEFLAPIGTLKPDDLRRAFLEQAFVLKEAGVDGFIIETMTALEEITVAIEAVKTVSENLPVFASMAFDWSKKGFRTPMGVDVSSSVSAIIDLGVDAVGFNCGKVPVGEYEKLAGEFVAIAYALGEGKVKVFAEPNAGDPSFVGGRTVYSMLPEDFAAQMEAVYDAGVRIIGGCCGTGPEHIKAIGELLKRKKRRF
jgi:5-methyltetrahydrofolate--homocysteine methyltransferase